MSFKSSSSPVPAVVAIVAAVGAVAALAWYYRMTQRTPEPVPAGPVAPAVEADEQDDGGPAFPLPPPLPERERPANLMPLPPLDDSDRYFRLELAEVLDGAVTDLLVDQALIEKFVAMVDNLPRQDVAERIRPVGRLPGQFRVGERDEGNEYTIDPANYDRYDPVVNTLARADRDALYELYARFYPLLQEAYTNLGYPDAYFNDRVVAVIDHLLGTPEVDEPVTLHRPHVLYEYADPELESLSAGQKLLIRIGPVHRATVRQFLQDMRGRITVAPPGAN